MRRVLYHLNTPPPEIEGTEAVMEEVRFLQQQIPGDVVFLIKNRNRQLPGQIWLRGLEQAASLRQQEPEIEAHFVFHSELFPFPYLAFLKKPVIYTVVSGLGERPLFPPRFVINGLHRIIVSNEQDQQWLAEQGIHNTAAIRPGIDLTRFTPTNPPPLDPVRLLVASAPWTVQQFETKGVRALLEACQQFSWLRLIFLWRGVLYEEMQALISHYNVSAQVEVINRFVDVNIMFSSVHAAALIGNTARHIKAYPLSLLDALAAHRPVILSGCIPMSAFVEQHMCGLVVDGIKLNDLLEKLQMLRRDYENIQEQTTRLNMDAFSVEHMAAAYKNLLR